MITTLKNPKEPIGTYLISPNEVAKYIYNPPENVKNDIKIIRSTADKIQHKLVKRSLGCFAMGKYKHNHVCNENFEGSDKIGLDLDHLPNNLLEKTKKRLSEIEGIFMVFLSPSGDGLKCFFHLDRVITSQECFKYLYTWIWKNIFKEFKYIDTKSFTVSRLCFVSHDPSIFFDPFKTKLKLDNFMKDWERIALEKYNEIQKKEQERIAKRELKKVENLREDARIEGYINKVIKPFNINMRGGRRNTNQKIFGFFLGLERICGDRKKAKEIMLSMAVDYLTIKDCQNLPD